MFDNFFIRLQGKCTEIDFQKYIPREIFIVKTCPVSPVYTDSNSLLYNLYRFFIYLIVIWSFDCDESNVTSQLVSKH